MRFGDQIKKFCIIDQKTGSLVCVIPEKKSSLKICVYKEGKDGFIAERCYSLEEFIAFAKSLKIPDHIIRKVVQKYLTLELEVKSNE